MSSLPLKFLVLDASPQPLLASQLGLDEDTFELLLARDLPSALALAQQHPLTMALLDLDAAGADASLPALRDDGCWRGVPLILLASTPAQAAAWAAYPEGMAEVVLKPVAAPLLQARLRPLLALATQKAEVQERLQDLQRLSRLQAQVISALSHDVRTPLSALALNAELVARSSEAPPLRQAAQRMKGSLEALGRQIDHLVGLAGPGDPELRPLARPLDLRALVQDRLQALRVRAPAVIEWNCSGEGDARADADATLIGDALDALLQLAAEHGAPGPVSLVVDGHSRHTVTLRIQFAAVLPDAVQRQWFGGAAAQPGAPLARTGPALAEADSVVLAHGGSLIGRSRARDGTLFECMLPRGRG